MRKRSVTDQRRPGRRTADPHVPRGGNGGAAPPGSFTEEARPGGAGTAALPASGAPPGPMATLRPGPGAAPRPARRGGWRYAPSNWRVRWRLAALIIVPTIAVVILGGLRVSSAVSNALAFHRGEQLALLTSDVVQLAQSMEDERDLTAGFIASGRTAALRSNVLAQQHRTDQVAAKVTALARGIGSSYPAATRLDLEAVLARINDLPKLRAAALSSQVPPLPVIDDYTQAVDTLLSFTSATGTTAGNAQIENDVIVLTALARAEDQASEQRGTLYAALIAGRFGPEGLADLTAEQAQQTADLAEFRSAASLPEQQFYDNTVSGTQVDQSAFEESLATASGAGSGKLTIDAAHGTSPASDWYQNMSFTLGKMRTVESQLVGRIVVLSSSLQASAARAALVTGAITLLILLVVLLIMAFVARSMTRPLRTLRENALDIAERRLPEMVRRLSEARGTGERLEIEPIGVTSGDEIGEVARAFDQVHREAVRLAADEALLRGNMNAMFVNLSRRSQSLIERQLSVIDSLEQSEQEPARLSSLFRLDHLATRMRRNSENLLVLAGHEVSHRWSEPIPLVDVLRAAISEIEQYERVVLSVQPGIAVVGHAVNDVVHLVAELVENATAFSPEDSQVRITAQPLSSGGVLVDITDSGVGISDEEMEQANRRLDSPPVVDVSVSRRMGLFVVGRLSARHGIRVRLRHAPSGGLTALVWLPDTVAVREGTPLGRLRRFEMEEHGIGPSLSAPSAGTAGRADTIPQGLSATGNAAAQAAAAARIPRFSPSAPAQPAGGVLGAGRGGAISPGSARAGYGVQDPRAAVESGRGEHGPAPAARSAAREDPAAREDSDSAASPPGPQGSGTPGSGTPGGPAPGSAAGTPGSAAGAGLGRPGASGGYGIAEMPPAAPLRRGITVPEPAGSGEDLRLPIFDSLESDWFRRGGVTHDGQERDGRRERSSWSSPGDEGWRAAEAVAAPATGETTAAGLPRRVPQANLVPGSVGAEGTDAEGPSRSAEAARSRLASFQRGVRQARAAAPRTEEPWDG